MNRHLSQKCAVFRGAQSPSCSEILRFSRCPEVETLLGDPSKAKQKLGWVPEITLDQMIEEMAAADLAEAKKHALLKKHGYDVSVSVE